MKETRSKVLVVGGAGYVGSVLVRELLQQGQAVKVFDRLYYGDVGLKGIEDKLEIVIGDMRCLPGALLSDVCAVINVGGLSNDPTAEFNPQANFEMNTEASVNLARLCKDSGIPRYLFASSCSIYDIGVADQYKDVICDETARVQPRAAYAVSKFEAERKLLDMADDKFCPVILRKGTVYGFSPRMRYDLVVNTFVKDALSKGFVTVHYGGEMWRPLVEVRDVARAYMACLATDANLVRGQIFNIVYGNFRISELALRVQSALKEAGVKAEIYPAYKYYGVRSYRVSGEKAERVLGWRPAVSVEESVSDMIEKVRQAEYSDFSNPRFYNIAWLRLLEEADRIIGHTGYLLTAPAGQDGKAMELVSAGSRPAIV